MENSQAKERFLYIDNLRLLMIILVVMVHFAVTYSGIGSWYIVENTKLDIPSTILFGLFQSFTQAYFMGFLFLISGYFAAKSYNKKGGKRYLWERFIRLGIPTLIYMLIIHPFIVYVILGARWDRPGFFNYYSDYVLSLDFLGESGPLWFAFALLIFNCVYVLIRSFIKAPEAAEDKKLPGNGAVIKLILLISICAFIIRLVQPIDTDILNMQISFFSQYIILFIVGVTAGRYGWFSKIPYKAGRKWMLAVLVPGLLFWVIMMLTGGALETGLDQYKGGLYWQSAAYAIWESFTTVAMAIGLITWFREKYNRQSKLLKALSDSSFTVYMFHPPIIILVTLMMTDLHIHVLAKYLLACLVGIPLSFLISYYIIRRIPLLKKVL